jgi:deoxycytidine triphosphate deaminase
MPGFLTDRLIRLRLQAGDLIDDGTWDDANVRHASYTLRAGSRVEVERAAQSREVQRQRVAIALRAGGDPLELLPGDTALIYSIERLRLPNDVLGLTVARGLLFVEALAPENTYVDPGFSGNLYTTVTNLSNRKLRIEYGSQIARLFFYELSEDVATPYRTGPAIGIEQHLDSIPAISTLESIKKQPNADLLGTVEKVERAGPEIAELQRRQTRLTVAALTLSVVWPIVLLIVNTNESLGSVLGSGWAANAIGGIVATTVTLSAPKIWSRVFGT